MTPKRRRDNSPFRPNAPPLPVGPEYYDRALELVNYFRMQGNAPLWKWGASGGAAACRRLPGHGYVVAVEPGRPEPYMRYSLAGGYQATLRFPGAGPNLGHNRPGADDRGGATWLFETMGNRRIVLDAMHRRVNIGIAWNQWHFVLVVELEGITSNLMGCQTSTMAFLPLPGRVKNGVRLRSHADLSADVWYDPMPRPPTVGQLLRVNVYDLGTVVANLRPPPPGRQYWPEDWGAMTIEGTPSPRTLRPIRRAVQPGGDSGSYTGGLPTGANGPAGFRHPFPGLLAAVGTCLPMGLPWPRTLAAFGGNTARGCTR